jgi:hypothetical protein
VTERTFIGLWQAAEILTEGMADEGQIAQSRRLIDAMTFLDLAAKRGLCEVWGIKGHTTTPAKIEPAILDALALECDAGRSNESEEYREAAYEPKISGGDFCGQVWSRLRYRRDQIEALKRAPSHAPMADPHSPHDKGLRQLRLGPAKHEGLIHEAISAIYDACEQQGVKPPNIAEIAKPVAAHLGKRGFQTTGVAIKKLANKPQHAKRRHPKGVTIRGQLKELSALVIP